MRAVLGVLVVASVVHAQAPGGNPARPVEQRDPRLPWRADASELEALIELVQQPETRRDAAYALSTLRAEAAPAAGALAGALNTPDRRAVALALREIGPGAECAVEALVGAVRPWPEDALALVEALVAIGGASVPALRELAREEGVGRPSYLRALGEIGPAAREAAPELLEALYLEDPACRRSAAFALGATQESLAREHHPRLRGLLLAEELTTRSVAAVAVGRLGLDDEYTLSNLRALLIRHGPGGEDPQERVERAVFEAVQSLGERALPLRRVVLARLEGLWGVEGSVFGEEEALLRAAEALGPTVREDLVRVWIEWAERALGVAQTERFPHGRPARITREEWERGRVLGLGTYACDRLVEVEVEVGRLEGLREGLVAVVGGSEEFTNRATLGMCARVLDDAAYRGVLERALELRGGRFEEVREEARERLRELR